MTEYRIAKSDLSWDIGRKRIAGPDAKNPGEVSWTAERYYPSLQEACRAMLRAYLKDASPESVSEYRQIAAALESAERRVVRYVDEIASQITPPDASQNSLPPCGDDFSPDTTTTSSETF